MVQLLNRRAILAGGMAMSWGAASAQTDGGLVRIVLKTSKGAITFDLNAAKAPLTVRNFLRYVDMKLLDKSSFYRVSHVPNQPDHGLVEGGLRGERAKVLKPVAHESTLKTGLTHKDGTISMARRAPGTATADFFIVVGDQPGFDADPAAEGDKNGFAAFGQVVEGMDVVHAIFGLPVSATAGVGAMRGEMLKTPVTILTARRAT
ncbi:MAG: peptidylprolyl isomerase [Caulobacteraceae bacterium]|jgi:peptidyl-prolyl cis-trans isomerase A (cyclophilin A)|nr:peptidylprolyl isomerase [Caulobacteraceae bacterium]